MGERRPGGPEVSRVGLAEEKGDMHIPYGLDARSLPASLRGSHEHELVQQVLRHQPHDLTALGRSGGDKADSALNEAGCEDSVRRIIGRDGLHVGVHSRPPKTCSAASQVSPAAFHN